VVAWRAKVEEEDSSGRERSYPEIAGPDSEVREWWEAREGSEQLGYAFTVIAGNSV